MKVKIVLFVLLNKFQLKLITDNYYWRKKCDI
jgi:hypothetical protein